MKLNFNDAADRLASAKQKTGHYRERVRNHLDEIKNFQQPTYSADFAPIIEKLKAYEYHYPTEIPKDNGQKLMIGLGLLGVIGWGFTHTLLAHIGIVSLDLALFSLIFTAGQRAEKAFVQAFPQKLSLSEQKKRNGHIAVDARKAAIHVLKDHQSIVQKIPFTRPQVFDDATMAEAQVAYFYAAAQGILDHYVDALKQQLQSYLNSTHQNRGTYEESYKDPVDHSKKTRKVEFELLTFIRTANGIGYRIDAHTQAGYLDRVIALFSQPRGVAIVAEFDRKVGIAKFVFNLHNVTVSVEVDHDALVKAFLGVEPEGEAETTEDTIETQQDPEMNYAITLRPNGPSLELLNPAKAANIAQRNADLLENKQKLQKALIAQGFPNARVKNIGVGPILCAYKIVQPDNEDPLKVKNKQDSIRLSGKVPGLVIRDTPEGDLVAMVERPNIRNPKIAETIYLSELLAKSKNLKGELIVPIGLGIDGKPIFSDVVNFPHMLIGGQTKSGKSVFSNALLISLAMRYSPEQLQLSIFDPKGNEFTAFRNLPHLHDEPIYTDAADGIDLLLRATTEMDRRYRELLAPVDAADIAEYNQKDPKIKLGYWLIYIDEYADLMGAADKETAAALEAAVQRLVQKARGAGIHLIIATQRPSADIMDPKIRSQIPARVALKVDNSSNSNIIINSPGAENLAGFGDGFVKLEEFAGMQRFKSPFVSKQELIRVADWIKSHNGDPMTSEPKSASQGSTPSEPQTPTADSGDTKAQYLAQEISDPVGRKVFMDKIGNEIIASEQVKEALKFHGAMYRQSHPDYSMDLDSVYREVLLAIKIYQESNATEPESPPEEPRKPQPAQPNPEYYSVADERFTQQQDRLDANIWAQQVDIWVPNLDQRVLEKVAEYLARIREPRFDQLLAMGLDGDQANAVMDEILADQKGNGER